MMTTVILVAAVVLASVLLLAAPFTIWQRIREAPEHPRPLWEERDPVQIEAALLRRLETRLAGLPRHDGLMDIARGLAFEYATEAQEPLLDEEVLHGLVEGQAGDFGGEVVAVTASWTGSAVPDEDGLAAELAAGLRELRVAPATHWGLGVAYRGGRAAAVVLLGRKAWTWLRRPPMNGDPGFPVGGAGRPESARWTQLTLVAPDGSEQGIEMLLDKDERASFEIVLGPQPGEHHFMAGPPDDRIWVARVMSGPLS